MIRTLLRSAIPTRDALPTILSLALCAVLGACARDRDPLILAKAVSESNADYLKYLSSATISLNTERMFVPQPTILNSVKCELLASDSPTGARAHCKGGTEESFVVMVLEENRWRVASWSALDDDLAATDRATAMTAVDRALLVAPVSQSLRASKALLVATRPKLTREAYMADLAEASEWIRRSDALRGPGDDDEDPIQAKAAVNTGEAINDHTIWPTQQQAILTLAADPAESTGRRVLLFGQLVVETRSMYFDSTYPEGKWYAFRLRDSTRGIEIHGLRSRYSDLVRELVEAQTKGERQMATVIVTLPAKQSEFRAELLAAKTGFHPELALDEDLEAAKCNHGNADACISLSSKLADGVVFVEGLGIRPDKKAGLSMLAKGLGYYRADCDHDIGHACTRLGAFAQVGVLARPDFVGAATLFDRACSLNDAEGCGSLGLLHLAGAGVPKDLGKAKSLSQRGCDSDDAASCNNLATILMRGSSESPPDPSAALTLYRKACDKGSPKACLIIGQNAAPAVAKTDHYEAMLSDEQSNLSVARQERNEWLACGNSSMAYSYGVGMACGDEPPSVSNVCDLATVRAVCAKAFQMMQKCNAYSIDERAGMTTAREVCEAGSKLPQIPRAEYCDSIATRSCELVAALQN